MDSFLTTTILGIVLTVLGINNMIIKQKIAHQIPDGQFWFLTE